MKKKHINRRKFLVSSLQGAAGLAILSSCNKRDIVGTDIRMPSAPVGLDNNFTIENDAIKEVVLTWKPHNLTDITGAKTETGILGYNVFRSTDLNSAGQQLNASLLSGTSFTDASVFADNTSYFYRLQVIDASGNTSPDSVPLEVYITPQSPVYVAENPAAVTGSPNFKLVYTEVKKTVDAAVIAVAKGLTPVEPAGVGEAYQTIFGTVTAQTLVGIKINTLAASGLCTHPEVVRAIAEGLTQMLGATFPVYNIVVFDDRYCPAKGMRQMVDAGFPLQDATSSYRIASVNFNTLLNGVGKNNPESEEQLWSRTVDVAGVQQRLSSIVDKVDYIINVPVLKDHSNAGITFALKNFYGVVDMPGSLHPDMCNRSIPALYSYVKDKVKLVVGDGLLAAFNGGPATSASFAPCQIIAGTDPVATDAYALKTINAKRTERGIANYSFSASGDARHILTAAKPPYKLGSINPKTIAVVV